MNQQTPPQENVLNITARPALYIDVYVNNVKQTYELETAKALQEQLGLALASLNRQPEHETDGESDSPNLSLTPDVPTKPNGDDSPAVGDAEPPEAA